VRENVHYAIDLEIDPSDRRIGATGTMRLPSRDISDGRIELYLHNQLELTSISAGGAENLIVDMRESKIRFMPEAVKIVITLEDAVLQADHVDIEFAYGGRITEWPDWSANVIGDGWTEIGLYFPWFPYRFGAGAFTYELNVVCDPNFVLASIGGTERTETGWSVSCPDPTNDIVLCLAKDFKIHESDLGRNTLRIYHSSIPDSILETLSADIASIARHYDRWFGVADRDLVVVESRRLKGGGYGRIGGIFLGGFDGSSYSADREDFNRYFAHEIAHQWWQRAPASSWEDWLNESFAEYSALLLILENFGAESFKKRLDEKKSAAEGTSPLWDFDRNDDPDSYRILYSKGPVLLNMLEQKVGRSEFMRLCSEVFSRSIAGSSDFLDLLEECEGSHTRRWFEEQMKTL
jgi:hypothetical protein